MRFVAPSALPPWRVHFPEPRPESVRAARHRAQPACRPEATPRRPDDSGGTSRLPLPDDRRIGCRDERWSAPGGSVRRGTAGVLAVPDPATVSRHGGPRSAAVGSWRPGDRALPRSEELGRAARPVGSWSLVASSQARFVPPSPFLTTLAVCPSPGPSGMFHPVTLVGFGSGWNHPREGPCPGGPRASPSAESPAVSFAPPGRGPPR